MAKVKLFSVPIGTFKSPECSHACALETLESQMNEWIKENCSEVGDQHVKGTNVSISEGRYIGTILYD